MSTETLHTLTEQYRFQVEALQRENERLSNRLKEAERLLTEVMEGLKQNDDLETKNYNLL